jgi:hypothetical protein
MDGAVRQARPGAGKTLFLFPVALSDFSPVDYPRCACVARTQAGLKELQKQEHNALAVEMRQVSHLSIESQSSTESHAEQSYTPGALH